MMLCVVIVLIALLQTACGSTRANNDLDIQDGHQLETEGTEVLSCSFPDDCPSALTCRDGVCSDVVCEPGKIDCWMGLIRRCNEDGRQVEYMPCDPGKTCIDNGCTQNTATIYFASAQSTACDDNSRLLRPSAVEPLSKCYCQDGRVWAICALADELSQLAPGEYSFQVPFWPESQYGHSVLYERFMIRHIVSELQTSEGLRFSLIKRPSNPGIPETGDYGDVFYRWINGYQLSPQGETPVLSSCHMGGVVPGFDQYVSSVVAGLQIVGYNPCLDYLPGSDISWFVSHLNTIVAVWPWGNSKDIMKWVDEKVEVTVSGKDCSEPRDCENGLCFSGKCGLIDNPELPGHLFDDKGNLVSGSRGQPMLWYSANYLRLFSRMQGVSCTTDEDCLDPLFHCNGGQCDDPARFCRRHHLVQFINRTDADPSDMQHCPVAGTLDSNRIALWMRYGSYQPCTIDEDCPGPQRCHQFPNSNDKFMFGAPRVCIYKYLDADSMTSAGPNEMSLAFKLPGPFLTDRNGDRLVVTVHEIDEKDVFHSGALAEAGGGISTVMSNNCVSTNMSYMDFIKKLSFFVTDDLDKHQCTLSDIPAKYLPGIKPPLKPQLEWDVPMTGAFECSLDN